MLSYNCRNVRSLSIVIVVISIITMAATVASAAQYYNNKSLRKHLKSPAKQNPDLVRVDRIAQSTGNRRVWLVELGKGAEQDRKTRPAMLVVAGAEGNDLARCSIAVSWIEHLIEQYETDTQITKLLQTTTISSPDIVSIQGNDLKVISGGQVTYRFFKHAQAVKRRPERVELAAVGGMSAVRVQFIVEGKGEFTVTLDSVKGGSLKKSRLLP